MNTITARARAMAIRAPHSSQGPNTSARSPLNSSSSTRATCPIIWNETPKISRWAMLRNR